jgi:predicted nucleic acid-binding protein
LNDPKDDFVLELGVESGCDFIITFNIRDFIGVERFGLTAITPREFLKQIGEIS